jgi:hypothetical protein
MPKTKENPVEIDDTLEDELDDIGIDDEDFGFVISPDGELKAVFLPDAGVTVIPKTVQKILKIFKIDDISQIELTTSETLH